VNAEAFDAIGPRFVRRGWVFFAPHRRGQGLSQDAGTAIGGEIASTREQSGDAAADAFQVRSLSAEHADGQAAALAWLRSQAFVK
jgi:hypothetical protein